MRTFGALFVFGTVLLILLTWWPGGSGLDEPEGEPPSPERIAAPDVVLTPDAPQIPPALSEDREAPAPRKDPAAPAGEISGVVMDDDGQGLPNVGLWILPADPDGGGRPAGTACSVTTDERGGFHVGGLAEGEFEIQVRPPPGMAPIPSVAVRTGMRQVEIRLRRAPDPTVRVLDPSGAPVEGARVTAVRMTPPIRIVKGVTGPDGAVTLSGMDETLDWVLTVDPPPKRPGLRRVSKQNWEPGDTSMTLESAFRITGVVLELVSGTPVSHARVTWRDGKESNMTTCDDLGRFEVRSTSGLPVQLHATAGDARSADLEVATGTEGATLRIDLGICLTVCAESWPRGPLPAPATLLRDGVETPARATGSQAGVWLFPRLVEGAYYTLRIAGTPDGRSLLLPGVRAKAGEIQVKPVPGRAIRGRLVLPAGAGTPRVSARAFGIGIGSLVDSEGRFEIVGLTDELWTVTGECMVGGVRWRGQASVRAGEPARITLKPETGR